MVTELVRVVDERKLVKIQTAFPKREWAAGGLAGLKTNEFAGFMNRKL